MSHVYIGQLKCPGNHCVMAAFGLFKNDEAAKALCQAVMEQFNEWVLEHKLDPACFVCGARELHVDVGSTRYTSMEEATEPLQRQEAAQMAAQAILRLARKAAERARNN